MKNHIVKLILSIFLNVSLVSFATINTTEQMEADSTQWIEINHDCSIRFLYSKNIFHPEIKITTNPNNIANLNEESLITFKSSNNTISQFRPIIIKKCAIGKYAYISAVCEGNSNFFINNRVTTIFMRNEDSLCEFNLPSEKGFKVKDTFNMFKKSVNKKRTKNNTKTSYSYFNRVSAGYDVMLLNHNFGSLNGVNFQYVHGFGVVKAPLFIEVGADVSYNTTKYFSLYELKKENRLNSLSIRVPINISYKFDIKEKFSIQPFTGLNLKINTIFNKYFAEIDENNYVFYDEVGNNKLFQVGWQIGLGFNISKLYIGLQYGIDFMARARVDWIYYPAYGYPAYGTYDFKSSRFLLNIGISF